jgi:hypothetical protein
MLSDITSGIMGATWCTISWLNQDRHLEGCLRLQIIREHASRTSQPLIFDVPVMKEKSRTKYKITTGTNTEAGVINSLGSPPKHVAMCITLHIHAHRCGRSIRAA